MREKVKANLYKRKLEISIKQDRENYRETAPYLEQQGHHYVPLSALTKNNTN